MHRRTLKLALSSGPQQLYALQTIVPGAALGHLQQPGEMQKPYLLLMPAGATPWQPWSLTGTGSP